MDKPSDKLSRFLRERRRPGPPRRVFFLRQNFFLEEECVRAFQTCGFTVREFQVGESWDGGLASRLLTDLVEFQPDFLFCINHIGFDKTGWLTTFLQDSHLPAATWYVDNPDFIIKAYPENVSDWVAIFVWDKHYMAGLKELGFPWVTYLPLAADTRLFRPYRHPPLGQFGRHGAAFVGSTWTARVDQQLARYAGQRATLAYLEAAAQNFQWGEHYLVRMDLADVFPGFADLPVGEQVDLEAAVLWLACQQDRLSRVGALCQAGLKVFGDAVWADFLPDPGAYGGSINYHRELPAFYQCVEVNLNLTSLQMKNGLNQRVFDVPAAGAFLLTDYKEALWELFLPEEVVTFSTMEEAQDKLAYYQKYPGTRQQIATRARERILSRHTYGHRVQVIERQLTETFFL
ncbi:MAG: glycosyltransferase [Desulfobaccales bacterium]